MKRLALMFFLYGIFLVPTNALAVDTIRIAYSSVNPHALLVSMAEKRGLYAKHGCHPRSFMYRAVAPRFRPWFPATLIWVN
jgi:hypothetical protein